jgi:hypothetical protein
MSESSPVPRRMNGLLQMLLLTDQTLAELAAARQEDAAELGDVLRQAVGEEHSDLVRSLAEAEARCAELAGELDLARAERHRCRRDLAVADDPRPPDVGRHGKLPLVSRLGGTGRQDHGQGGQGCAKQFHGFLRSVSKDSEGQVTRLP